MLHRGRRRIRKGTLAKTARSPKARQRPGPAITTITDKGYCLGTHRKVPPAKTLEKVMPLLTALGITRVANITGLDDLGIPVYMACRPNSRSLAVFQGKGLDQESAKASAIMEAVETYHAESIDLPLKYASLEEICYSHAIAEVDRMPLSVEGQFDPLAPIFWIEGTDLITGSRRWLPFELVHANYTLPHMPGSGAFAATTNGLASGNVMEEAIAHALFEVIERDAVTLWKLRGDRYQQTTVMDPDSVTDPACRDLIGKIRAADMDLVIWNLTSDIGIPTFQCLISGRNQTTGAPEFGAGTHLSPAVALARALTEAAQARTTYITGARDDITAEAYADETASERFASATEVFRDHRPIQKFNQLKDLASHSLAQDLDLIVDKLARKGISEIMMVDLSKDHFRIPVVRVVVPGLEGALEGPHADYVPGERAMRYLEGRS